MLWNSARSEGGAFFDRRGSSERHANAFAAALLMPKPIVLSICSELNRNHEPLIRWADFLAYRLGVSREAARVRLKEVAVGRW
jgi:Zn-dependent peptidase ImmA (M78 family)